MIPHQGETPAGELDPDLMAPPRMEPDMDQGGISAPQADKFQPGFFYTFSLPLHHEDLVLALSFQRRSSQSPDWAGVP